MNLRLNEKFYDQSGEKNYRVDSILNSQHGTLYLVEEEQTKEKFVLKIQSKRTPLDRQVLELLVKNKFLNLVNTISFGNIQMNRQPYFIMEYCRESLLEKITKKGTIKNEEFRYVAFQIATGLKELHDLGLVHRNIKPENIMHFDHQDQGTKKMQTIYKISDCYCISNQPVLPPNQRTPYYTAPEQLYSQAINCTNKVDIWALGAVFYELVKGQPLFLARVQEDCYKLIQNSEIYQKIEKLDLKPEYQKLIKDMLNREPNKRLDIDSVLKVLKPKLTMSNVSLFANNNSLNNQYKIQIEQNKDKDITDRSFFSQNPFYTQQIQPQTPIIRKQQQSYFQGQVKQNNTQIPIQQPKLFICSQQQKLCGQMNNSQVTPQPQSSTNNNKFYIPQQIKKQTPIFNRNNSIQIKPSQTIKQII